MRHGLMALTRSAQAGLQHIPECENSTHTMNVATCRHTDRAIPGIQTKVCTPCIRCYVLQARGGRPPLPAAQPAYKPVDVSPEGLDTLITSIECDRKVAEAFTRT